MAYRGGMKYFRLTNEKNNPFPQVINLSQSLDVRKLNRKDFQILPPFFLLDMNLGLDAFIPDILISPFLLVSRTVMEIITLYDADMPFRFTALFDTKRGECAGFYCPILEEEDCVIEQTSKGKEALVLDRERMTGASIFRVKRGEIIIRLDLVESLLSREAIGIELQEVFLTV